MPVIQNFYCCGMAEIHGVQKFRASDFHTFLSCVKPYRKGAFLFSYATNAKRPTGRAAAVFANRIREAGLGEVHKLPHFKNPNTSRTIVPYFWIVNRAALATYLDENKIVGIPRSY